MRLLQLRQLEAVKIAEANVAAASETVRGLAKAKKVA